MTDVIDEARADEIADELQDPTGLNEPLDDQPPVDEIPDEEPVGDESAAAPRISPAIVERARQYGLSESDLQGFDDARAGSIFAAIDRARMRPEARGAEAPASEQPAPAGGYVPLKVEYGDDLDESLVKPVQAVVDHVNGTMQQLQDFRQEIAREVRALNVLREFGEFDRFVSGLGEDWASVYGTGATADMDAQSPELKKRLEVFQGAKALMGDAARRGSRLGLSDAHLRSHRSIHWERIVEQERSKTDKKVEQRRRTSGERPVKGKTAVRSVRDNAIAAFERR